MEPPAGRLPDVLYCNVFAHNRDDHSRNFSYLYDEQEACYKLTILEAAVQAGIRETQARKIACDIRECVEDMLEGYLKKHMVYKI